MHDVIRIARKELGSFFASPVAYIFLGSFLAASLFVFFWVDTFFARNIADARPLFEWMPVLLIFLVAALTMRSWSEERRAGTLELLLTLPVSPLRLVLGKFLGSLGLVAVAVVLTLPLPVTISWLGPLDWGPVLGGYLAALFLAAAYVAIGLFVSARTNNQIVSLIGSVLICSLFYLLGSHALTGLLGHRGAELLQLLGAGSRFESITRGVIDLRDLYFYLSIVGTFLTLNVYSLERLRWAEQQTGQGLRSSTHRKRQLLAGLLVANFLAGNLWLQQIGWARTDMTEGHIYSISEATRSYLDRLQEPLLIRGYFSAQTHPLLAPLVPQLRDLLREYEVAGDGKVRVEFVDPLEDPELEREAGEKYGIRPVAFQTASKYQAAVVNSYFDVLVQYGDQHEVLGFRDLIEVKLKGDTDLDVRLRNPEYDITRTIKKALYGYQGGGNLFENLREPVKFRGFISPDASLPEPLPQLRKDLQAVLDELQTQAGGKLQVEIQDPQAPENSALAEEIADRYGFHPLTLGLLDPQSFYFYMVLESADQTVPVPLPEGLDKAGLERSLQAALKRFAGGFLRTLALYVPEEGGQLAQFGMGGGDSYQFLKEGLQENVGLRNTNLKDGRVPEEADLLLLVSPHELDRKQLFAIDQFLMQGGTVMLAASPFEVKLGGQAVSAVPRPTGLEDWLQHKGIDLEPKLVLDPQNTPFPIPVERQVGDFVVQEIHSLAYPFFPDIREDGMSPDNGITAGLGQLTLNWASPIVVDQEKNAKRTVTRLLQSSPQSWTSDSPDIQPDFERYGDLGFPEGEKRGRQLLAVDVEGQFQSYFQGQPSPLVESEAAPEPDPDEPKPEDKGTTKPEPVVSGVVDHSPESARIILVGSGSFLGDTALDLAMQATRTRYMNPIQLVQNAIDWSLEDRGLLEIRGRSQFSRLLLPLDRESQMFWEYLNYALSLGGLVTLYLLQRRSRRHRRQYYREVLELGGTQA